MGDPDKKFVFDDQVKGRIEFPENDQDAVIMKSDNYWWYGSSHIDTFYPEFTYFLVLLPSKTIYHWQSNECLLRTNVPGIFI